jgi:peptidyl-prolyl cis-trans isomerase A (cyclophilin A)
LTHAIKNKELASMRKLIIMLLLLAGLAACSGNTDTPPAEVKSETPAAEPVKAAEATPPPADPAPAEPAKAADASKAADVKSTDKPATPPPANKGRLLARFQTSMGNFTAELNEKEAPGTVANFAGLASGEKEWTDPRNGQKQKKPYYDGLTFHRIIAGFMIQGGDPLGNGTGGPGFGIKDEFNNLKHDSAGVLAMARTGMPDSAGSQFYITLGPQPNLDVRSIAPDGRQVPYVVFGKVIEGLDAVMKIGSVSTAPGDRPLTPVVINKITIERK